MATRCASRRRTADALEGVGSSLLGGAAVEAVVEGEERLAHGVDTRRLPRGEGRGGSGVVEGEDRGSSRGGGSMRTPPLSTKVMADAPSDEAAAGDGVPAPISRRCPPLSRSAATASGASASASGPPALGENLGSICAERSIRRGWLPLLFFSQPTMGVSSAPAVTLQKEAGAAGTATRIGARRRQGRVWPHLGGGGGASVGASGRWLLSDADCPALGDDGRQGDEVASASPGGPPVGTGRKTRGHFRAVAAWLLLTQEGGRGPTSVSCVARRSRRRTVFVAWGAGAANVRTQKRRRRRHLQLWGCPGARPSSLLLLPPTSSA